MIYIEEKDFFRTILNNPEDFCKVVSTHHLAKKETTERNYQLVYDKAKGMSIKEISKKYNLSEGRCTQIIDKLRRQYINSCEYVGIFVNNVLVWKTKDRNELVQIKREQEEYHKNDKIPVKVTFKLLPNK